jgi:hypothetical protein
MKDEIFIQDKSSFFTDAVFVCVIPAIVAIVVMAFVFGVQYGNGTQYDIINPTSQFIDQEGNYHFSGLLITRNCGNVFDHTLGMRGYTFTVSEELFYKSFNTNRMTLSYQCKDGRIEDIKWGV